MVRLCTAKKWNLKQFEFTCGDENEPEKVTKIKCVVCSEFYQENERELRRLQGTVKAQTQKWISGSDVIKKTNALKHLKSNAHSTACKRLRETRSSSQTADTEGQKIAAATCASEKTIVEHVRCLSVAQKSQLIKKFQLVHFLAVNNKPLHFYQQLVKFQKEVYSVDLGTGYLNKNAAQKMLLYLSKAVITEHLT